jgi:hypothetical protein
VPGASNLACLGILSYPVSLFSFMESCINLST